MHQQSLGDILGKALRAQDWNNRLAQWSKPASDTEEAQIERAATMVRRVLSQNEWLTSEGVIVIPQGSYHNNTNVRLKADMDLCVRHPTVELMYGRGVSADHAFNNLGFVEATPIAQVALELRAQVASSLLDYFGEDNVEIGTKAIKIAAVPGSRSDIDVVPVFRFQHIEQGLGLLSPYRVTEGVVIRSPYDQNPPIYNFPNQHHENGVSKRAATSLRFKRIVRQMKSMRDLLVTEGFLANKQVPSFLIESLVYRVEDGHFLVETDDARVRFRRILVRMSDQLVDTEFVASAGEINDAKLLFGGHQPWAVSDATAFVDAALERTNA